MDHSQNSAHESEQRRPLERTRSFDEEPKQPTNIPDRIEHALQNVDDAKLATEKQAKRESQQPTALSRDDVKYLFSGAPHFMLEKGRHNHWYPHAIFPWDTSLPIQDLWDREAMRHESFTLATLHAHLPVPNNLPLKGGSSINGSKGDCGQATESKPEPWKYEDGVKRPTYDLGIFEVPNMLSMNGKEPGAVGFRHFLELATADAVRYKPDIPRGEFPDPHLLSCMPLTDAFDTLSHLKDAYSQCNQDIVLNRHQFLSEGPAAWKRIGVRDVSVKDIVERLATLSDIRAEAMDNTKITILDIESTKVLHEQLFTKFLFPRPRGWNSYAHEELKAQIEVLTKVLAVKGAWLNLSLPEWRLRVGQILWEMPPHADGDCMDCLQEHDPVTEQSRENKNGARPTPNLDNGLERKWLLLQLVLAGELLVRLDAIVHLAVSQHSEDLSVTAQDVRELDKLRHGKVNWDILFFRRFSDNLTCKYIPKATISSIPEQSQQLQQIPPTAEPQNPTKRHGLRSKLGSLSQHFPRRHSIQQANGYSSAEQSAQVSIWDCVVITPRHPERQLKGLAVFAQIIGWPGYETLEARIRTNMQQKDSGPLTPETVRSAYRTPVRNEETSRIFSKKETYSRNLSHRYVVLHDKKTTTTDNNNDLNSNIGGWLSRSWLTGLVMPGESISQLLMATLLENDPKALHILGTVSNLYGGLSYGDRKWTWWSTKCIVGRVLAALEGSRVCMGWVRADITPVADGKETTLRLRDTWFSIDDIQEPLQKNTRIRQRTRMVIESSPLGKGRVANDTFTIPVDDSKSPDFNVKLNRLALSQQKNTADKDPVKKIFLADQALLSFDITTATTNESVVFPLKYNVGFISSYTCRPPRGEVTQAQESASHTDKSSNKDINDGNSNTKCHTHLPGHPLHKSYRYKYVPLQDLRPSTRPPIIDFATISTKDRPSLSGTKSIEHTSTTIDGDSSREKGEEEEHEQEQEPVWILDARCSRDKEAFARAWCASVGVHALIGRVGRTCLACCVREARAVGVGVVIRVGSATASKPAS